MYEIWAQSCKINSTGEKFIDVLEQAPASFEKTEKTENGLMTADRGFVSNTNVINHEVNHDARVRF